MFKTLFSRMLVTYLALTLLLLTLLGVTLGGMFRNQYIDEKESELRREAAEINAAVCEKYVDPEKRGVAKSQFEAIVRQYDALLQLYFNDDVLGKVTLMDAESADKWAPIAEMDMTEQAKAIVESGAESVSAGDYASVSGVPMMTLKRPIVDAAGDTIGAMFLHVDMSRTNASVRQVYMDVLLSALIAVIFAFLAVSYTANRMTRPVTEMNNAVKRFSRGEFEARVAVSGTDEVSQLGESFNEMADEINALEQSRRSFVANVSHELRSPLTSMRGFLEAMQDGTIPAAEQGKYLSVVIGECKRMTGMVNDLLDLARIESGMYELKIAPFDVNELVIRTLLTFEARVNARRIEVVMDFERAHRRRGDSAQIAQVIRNLVDNAVKFSPEGGRLTLGIRASKAPPSASGMKARAYARRTCPTCSTASSRGEGAHARGLRRSSAFHRKRMEQHGEEIGVASEPGRGTCFTFTLNTRTATRARTSAQRVNMEYPNYYYENQKPAGLRREKRRGVGGYVVTAVVFTLVGALLATILRAASCAQPRAKAAGHLDAAAHIRRRLSGAHAAPDAGHR